MWSGENSSRSDRGRPQVLGRGRLRSGLGARPLKRSIQRELQDPLALKILSGEFHEGETIKVERGEEGLTFTADVPVVEGEVVNE